MSGILFALGIIVTLVGVFVYPLAILIGVVMMITGFILSGLRIVRPMEMGAVERLGKFISVKKQGITFIIPFIDSMTKVSIAETLVDVEPQEVITKDNLNAQVDAQVYYKIKETDTAVYKALYKADDYRRQIINLARTTLRDVLGNMMFEDANKQRGKINSNLQKTLERESDAWGISIVRTEIAEITPPKDVQQTMNDILKANNKKVANKDYAIARKIEAEGFKDAEIEKAQGLKRASILEAEGQAQAIREVAKANAERIKLVNESAQKHFKGNAQVLKSLETTENSLANGTKYIVPSDSSLNLVIGEASGVVPIKKK